MGLIATESCWKSAIFSRIRSSETQKLIKKWKKNFLACLGFDLGTFGLQNQCSTTELQGLFIRILVFLLFYFHFALLFFLIFFFHCDLLFFLIWYFPFGLLFFLIWYFPVALLIYLIWYFPDALLIYLSRYFQDANNRYNKWYNKGARDR